MCACQNYYDERELTSKYFFLQNHIDLAKVYEPSNSTEKRQNMNITSSKCMEQNYYVSLSLKENLLYQDKQKMFKNCGSKIQDTAGDSKSSHHRSLPNSWKNITERGGKCNIVAVHTTQVYGRVDAWLHILPTLALVRSERQTSWSAVLPPFKELP